MPGYYQIWVTYNAFITRVITCITMKVLAMQSCLTLCYPMDWSPPGSSDHWILCATILEWFALAFSRGSFQPRDWTQVSCIAGRFFTAGGQREALRPWQRSWGRRLGIRKGGIEPQESPWIFLSIYPQKPESAYFNALCSHLHLGLYGRLSPTTLFGEGVNLELQLIIILGRDRSVST